MENINTKAVVRLIGVNENTLRGWERRYGAVEPKRDEDGRRLYSSKDVERIKLLWALVKEGHNIGKIAKLSSKVLKSMLSKTLSPEVPTLPVSEHKAERYLPEIISALEKFNLEKLNQCLLRARFEISTKEIVINLIRPLMMRVGDLIQQDKLTITQEHVLSALLRDFLGSINQSLSPYDFSSRGQSKSVLLTTREGDIHEFGILLSSILCNLYRYKTYYLGPNMPLDDLVQACSNFKVDYLLLGLMNLPEDREIISAREFVSELDKRLPRKITFCLGGSGSAVGSLIRSDRQYISFADLYQLDHFLRDKA